MANGDLSLSIWRGAETGKYMTHSVPLVERQTVLDLITHIQRTRDPSLSYRFACRVGMCGSCAMTVNGVPRWTCRTLVSDVAMGGKLTIEPLRNLPVIKDLVTDMSGFFDKWQRAGGTFVPASEPASDFALIPPTDKKRQAVDAAIECIGCGICYAACDVVAWNRDYLGPAALNRSWSLINDERDGNQMGRLRAIAAEGGCRACHSQQSCVEHCPKGLNPTASIAGLKRAMVGAFLKGRL